MINNSLNLTTNNIKEKNLSSIPFSHFYIDNVFPEDLFDTIHINWPELNFFENPATVQFNHRIMGYFLFVFGFLSQIKTWFKFISFNLLRSSKSGE